MFVVPQHLLDEVEFETYQRRDHLVQAMVTQILRLGGCDPAADLAGSPRSPVTAAAAAVTVMEAPEPEPEGADAADDALAIIPIMYSGVSGLCELGARPSGSAQGRPRP